MKAIMLAAGKGVRCYPLTHLYPKIFFQIGGIPLLEYMLSWFYGAPEVERVYIVVRNDPTASALKCYLKKRRSNPGKVLSLFARLGLKVEQANPDLELEVIQARGWGTGGDLRLAIQQMSAADELGESFLACNADYVTVTKLAQGKLSPQLNLSDMIGYHASCGRALGTAITVALAPVERKAAPAYGVARVRKLKGFNLVQSFIEKPEIQSIPQKPLVNAGVYVIDSAYILSHIDQFLPEKPATNLENTLLERLAGKGKPKLAAYVLDLCAWFDIGTPEELVDTNIYIASLKEQK